MDENKKDREVTISLEEYTSLAYKATGLVMLETIIFDSVELGYDEKSLRLIHPDRVMNVVKAIDPNNYNQVLEIEKQKDGDAD